MDFQAIEVCDYHTGLPYVEAARLRADLAPFAAVLEVAGRRVAVYYLDAAGTARHDGTGWALSPGRQVLMVTPHALVVWAHDAAALHTAVLLKDVTDMVVGDDGWATVLVEAQGTTQCLPLRPADLRGFVKVMFHAHGAAAAGAKELALSPTGAAWEQVAEGCAAVSEFTAGSARDAPAWLPRQAPAALRQFFTSVPGELRAEEVVAYDTYETPPPLSEPARDGAPPRAAEAPLALSALYGADVCHSPRPEAGEELSPSDFMPPGGGEPVRQMVRAPPPAPVQAPPPGLRRGAGSLSPRAPSPRAAISSISRSPHARSRTPDVLFGLGPAGVSVGRAHHEPEVPPACPPPASAAASPPPGGVWQEPLLVPADPPAWSPPSEAAPSPAKPSAASPAVQLRPAVAQRLRGRPQVLGTPPRPPRTDAASSVSVDAASTDDGVYPPAAGRVAPRAARAGRGTPSVQSGGSGVPGGRAPDDGLGVVVSSIAATSADPPGSSGRVSDAPTTPSQRGRSRRAPSPSGSRSSYGRLSLSPASPGRSGEDDQEEEESMSARAGRGVPLTARVRELERSLSVALEVLTELREDMGATQKHEKETTAALLKSLKQLRGDVEQVRVDSIRSVRRMAALVDEVSTVAQVRAEVAALREICRAQDERIDGLLATADERPAQAPVPVPVEDAPPPPPDTSSADAVIAVLKAENERKDALLHLYAAAAQTAAAPPPPTADGVAAGAAADSPRSPAVTTITSTDFANSSGTAGPVESPQSSAAPSLPAPAGMAPSSHDVGEAAEAAVLDSAPVSVHTSQASGADREADQATLEVSYLAVAARGGAAAAPAAQTFDTLTSEGDDRWGHEVAELAARVKALEGESDRLDLVLRAVAPTQAAAATPKPRAAVPASPQRLAAAADELAAEIRRKSLVLDALTAMRAGATAPRGEAAATPPQAQSPRAALMSRPTPVPVTPPGGRADGTMDTPAERPRPTPSRDLFAGVTPLPMTPTTVGATAGLVLSGRDQTAGGPGAWEPAPAPLMKSDATGSMAALPAATHHGVPVVCAPMAPRDRSPGSRHSSPACGDAPQPLPPSPVARTRSGQGGYLVTSPQRHRASGDRATHTTLPSTALRAFTPERNCSAVAADPPPHGEPPPGSPFGSPRSSASPGASAAVSFLRHEPGGVEVRTETAGAPRHALPDAMDAGGAPKEGAASAAGLSGGGTGGGAASREGSACGTQQREEAGMEGVLRVASVGSVGSQGSRDIAQLLADTEAFLEASEAEVEAKKALLEAERDKIASSIATMLTTPPQRHLSRPSSHALPPRDAPLPQEAQHARRAGSSRGSTPKGHSLTPSRASSSRVRSGSVRSQTSVPSPGPPADRAQHTTPSEASARAVSPQPSAGLVSRTASRTASAGTAPRADEVARDMPRQPSGVSTRGASREEDLVRESSAGVGSGVSGEPAQFSRHSSVLTSGVRHASRTSSRALSEASRAETPVRKASRQPSAREASTEHDFVRESSAGVGSGGSGEPAQFSRHSSVQRSDLTPEAGHANCASSRASSEASRAETPVRKASRQPSEVLQGVPPKAPAEEMSRAPSQREMGRTPSQREMGRTPSQREMGRTAPDVLPEARAGSSARAMSRELSMGSAAGESAAMDARCMPLPRSTEEVCADSSGVAEWASASAFDAAAAPHGGARQATVVAVVPLALPAENEETSPRETSGSGAQSAAASEMASCRSPPATSAPSGMISCNSPPAASYEPSGLISCQSPLLSARSPSALDTSPCSGVGAAGAARRASSSAAASGSETSGLAGFAHEVSTDGEGDEEWAADLPVALSEGSTPGMGAAAPRETEVSTTSLLGRLSQMHIPTTVSVTVGTATPLPQDSSDDVTDASQQVMWDALVDDAPPPPHSVPNAEAELPARWAARQLATPPQGGADRSSDSVVRLASASHPASVKPVAEELDDRASVRSSALSRVQSSHAPSEASARPLSRHSSEARGGSAPGDAAGASERLAAAPQRPAACQRTGRRTRDEEMMDRVKARLAERIAKRVGDGVSPGRGFNRASSMSSMASSRYSFRFLVADESEAALTDVKAIVAELYEGDARVDTASSPSVALGQLATSRYDAVLLTDGMPVLPGDQLLAFIRHDPRYRINDAAPVVLMHASDAGAAAEGATALGFAACVRKPVAAADLERVLQHVLSASPPSPRTPLPPPSPMSPLSALSDRF